MIARAGGVPPDTIRILTKEVDDKPVFYAIEDYNDCDIVVGFEHFPTFFEVKEEVKEMFIISLDLEWDEDSI